MPTKPNPAQQAIRCRRCALRCTTIPQRASALHTAQSTPAPQSTSAPRPADPLSARKSGPRPRRDPLPTRKTSASAWLSEPSPTAACSFNACLLLDQLAVVHLVGGTVDDDVPAVRHAGIRGVQVALRAVELAGLVGLMAVSAGHNAVLAPIMRIELAIGSGGGQVVDGVDAVMAAALQAEDGRMRKRPRRIAKTALVVPPNARRSVSHALRCGGFQRPATSLHCSPRASRKTRSSTSQRKREEGDAGRSASPSYWELATHLRVEDCALVPARYTR